MSRNQKSASFFINRDLIRRKTLESEPLITKSEMGEIPKFTTKRKNGIENKRYYINIRSVNPNDSNNNSNSKNNIGLR